MTQITSNGIPVPLAMAACEGRKAFRIRLDFSTGLTQELDFAILESQGFLKSVQTVYVDNRGNAEDIEFVMGATNQSWTALEQSQGYYNVLQGLPSRFTVSCASASVIVDIWVLNFFVPPMVWGQELDVTIPSIDAIIINGRLNVRTQPAQLSAWTNRSSTITAGGTGQILMNTNAARLQWDLQNPSTATEILQFSKVSITGPWYDLMASEMANEDGSTVYGGTIWVKAATTAHAFTAGEGT